MKINMSTASHLLALVVAIGGTSAIYANSGAQNLEPVNPAPKKDSICGVFSCIYFNIECGLASGSIQCANCYSAGGYCYSGQ